MLLPLDLLGLESLQPVDSAAFPDDAAKVRATAAQQERLAKHSVAEAAEDASKPRTSAHVLVVSDAERRQNGFSRCSAHRVFRRFSFLSGIT